MLIEAACFKYAKYNFLPYLLLHAGIRRTKHAARMLIDLIAIRLFRNRRGLFRVFVESIFITTTGCPILETFSVSLTWLRNLLTSDIWLPIQNGLRNFLLNPAEIQEFFESAQALISI